MTKRRRSGARSNSIRDEAALSVHFDAYSIDISNSTYIASLELVRINSNLLASATYIALHANAHAVLVEFNV